MFTKYAVHIRNRNGDYINRLTDIETLEITEVLNDPGSWSISSKTPYICPFNAGDGIVVSRDGELFYSGVLKEITEEYDAYERLYTWKVSGASDLDFLTRRVCYPDPSTGLTTTVSHYEDSGTLAEVVKRLIDKNLGPEALPVRQEQLVKSSVIGDEGSGVSVSLRFQNLLEAIKTLLDTQNFSIRANWDNRERKLYYQIYQSTNYDNVLLFSATLNSLLAVTYNCKAPEGNAVISGGEGEKTERSFAYANDDVSASSWGRIEYYHDMRATADDDLQTDADSTLQKLAEENQGQSALVNSNTWELEYKRNWNIGDFVAVEIHGSVDIQRVLQVKTTVAFDDETIEPVIGSVKHSQLSGIYGQLKQLRSDVNQLQWGSN